MMRLALINPLSSLSISPPLGLGYIASYLMKYGNYTQNEIKIVDFVAGDSYDDIVRFKPEVIGITATTPLIYNTSFIGQKIKAIMSEVPIILGGPHVTLLPHQALRNGPFDIGVIGEGEVTMLELIQTFEKQGSFIHENIKEIRGIAYKNGSDGVFYSGPRKWIEDLDSIPFPARKMMNIKFYLNPRELFSGFYARGLHIMASRGCPYNCAFCSTSVIWGRKYRKFSPQYVIEEIEELIYKYKIDGLYFADDIVGIDKKHFQEICNLMVKDRINEKITWVCETRVDLIDEDFIISLKRAGCGLIQFGFESGSQKVLDFLKKGTSVEQNSQAIKICKKHNLRVMGFFMIGSPTETEEDIIETIKFIKTHNLDQISVFITSPYPGTYLWNYLKGKGIVKEEDFDWRSLTMGSRIKFEDLFLLTDSIDSIKFKERYLELKKYAEEVDEKNRLFLVSLRWINPHMIRVAMLHPRGAIKLLAKYCMEHFPTEFSYVIKYGTRK